MIIAELNLTPMGTGTSASQYIRAIGKMLRDCGIKFVPGPMSTSIEANSLQEIFQIVAEANQVLVDMGVQRIVTSLKIDYSLDKDITIESKLKALQV